MGVHSAVFDYSSETNRRVSVWYDDYPLVNHGLEDPCDPWVLREIRACNLTI